MSTTMHTTGDARGLNATAPLWASAIVVLALILTQAGRGAAGSIAKAEMVHGTGGYTIMTADGGTDDVLLVLDNRNEELFVYQVANQRSVDLKERLSLTKLFADARAAAGGG